jgi:hypothetical protein
VTAEGLAAVVVGAAGVIAALGAIPSGRTRGPLVVLCVVLLAVAAGILILGSAAPSGSTARNGASPGGVAPPSAAPARSPAPAGSPASSLGVRWSGNVLLRYSYGSIGLDFDQTPPQTPTGPMDHDIYARMSAYGDSSELAIGPNAGGANWTAQRNPSQAECADLLATQDLGAGSALGQARAGLAFCVRTHGDRIAYARVLAVSQAGYQFAVIVWEAPAT